MATARGERAEASIKDVARQARVSIASVSRVMNGQPTVREETRNRVLAAVQSLNYVPHVGARSLITQKTNVVGVLLPDLHGEFFSELIRGLDGLARDRKRQLLLSSVHGEAEEVAAALRALRGKVDGLVVMSPHVDSDLLQRNLPSALPIVLLNSPIRGSGCSSFTIDSYRGARAMTRHLASRGHRRIAHLAGPPGNWDAEQRLRGYRDEMRRARPGVPLHVLPGDFTQRAGYEAGRLLAASSDRPDAVFAANDVLAIGCLVAFREAGVRVPEDVAVAGFDDIPLSSLVSPALTTMRVHIAELGRSALEHMMACLEDPKGTRPIARRLVPEVVVRDSSGAPTNSTGRSKRPINPR
ncbi:MAG TPA: LacI family DNA-binding transcriptional regulator [Myxococcaceae bacterium]|jgi:LacI family transcriptional regulator